MEGSTKLEQEVYEQYKIITNDGIENLLNKVNPMGGRMDKFSIWSTMQLQNIICRDKKMNKEIKLSYDNTVLDYKKGYTPEFVKSVIEQKKLKGMRLFAVLNEDRVESFDFLKDFNFLKFLSIASRDDHDYDFLNFFGGLHEFSVITEGKKIIDLKPLKELRKLVLEWRKNKILGIEHCLNLEYLAAIDFDQVDFSLLEKAPQLKTFRVKTSKIKSVHGLEFVPYLEDLLIANCRSLESVKSISNHKNLRTLHVEACKKIMDFEYLEGLPNLEKILIMDCGDIASLGFLRNFPSLNEFRLIGRSKIIDGDLSPLENIKTVVLP